MEDSGPTNPVWRRELIAGLTTFSAMAYILVVNPAMLSITGMDRGALLFATAVAAAAGSILMGALTRYPIALAPGMGLNAFFTFTICGQMEIPWQGALAMVFWTGILFLILTLTPFRERLVHSIPLSLKIGIQGGIGLFVVVIGLKNLGIFTDPAPAWIALRFADPDTFALGAIVLALLGCVLAFFLVKKEVPGALLIAIVAVAILGLFVRSGGTAITQQPEALIGLPPDPSPLLFQLDWLYPFRNWETVWLAMITLVFVDLFDSLGTLIGTSRQAGLTDENGELPRMKEALVADATATSIGACLGTSTTTSYIESAAGVSAGGRTGWTSLVVAVCFLLALFLHPLLAVIPAAAVAPALLVVGWLMMRSLPELRTAPWEEIISAGLIVLLIPLKFQIAEGIAFGFIAYTILMLIRRKIRKVDPMLISLSGIFLVRFVWEVIDK
ncbi:MAG: NCS2 family permease [Verrucomicrobiota bacterium]